MKNKLVSKLSNAKSPLKAISTIWLVLLCASGLVYASSTSNFTQTINAGTLAVDIVDASYVSVSSPSVAFGATTFSFGCLTGAERTSGTLGTASEAIYVSNPDAADNGWTVSLAASATTATWSSAGTDYDFNDATSSGCSDGADTDTVGGQMTVDPSVGTLTVGQCSVCTTTSVTKGSSTAFSEGVTDSITVLTGAVGSDDVGDWKLTGVTIRNTVPAEQPAASDYNIDTVLSVIAS